MTLADFPPEFEIAWRRAVTEGILIIPHKDRFDAQSNRNDLYSWRRQYIANGGDRKFASSINAMKVSLDPDDDSTLIIQPKHTNPRTQRLAANL